MRDIKFKTKRNIKFRAWDQELKYMLQWDRLEMYHFYDDDYILMEYMEHKDVNGKEIYEGDILIADYGYCGVVEHDWFTFMKSEILPSDYVEVIGNIYENPELLENTI
jgi:hypothetical protein